MSSFIEDNVVSIAALLISILSWVTSFFITRKETNKLKLAEKRQELRILISKMKTENTDLLGNYKLVKDQLARDLETIDELSKKHNQNIGNINKLIEALIEINSSVESTIHILDTIQEIITTTFTDQLLDSRHLKSPSDCVDLAGRIESSTQPVQIMKKNLEEIKKNLAVAHDEVLTYSILFQIVNTTNPSNSKRK